MNLNIRNIHKCYAYHISTTQDAKEHQFVILPCKSSCPNLIHCKKYARLDEKALNLLVGVK